MARETCLDARWAAWFAGRLADRVGVREVARAALGAAPPAEVPRWCDLFLDGWAMALTAGLAAGAATMKRQ